jgi:hypothetical protein
VIEQDIYNRLNTSSVTAIVADRIYPTDPNENTNWPFVTYKTTGTQPVLSMAGSSPLALYAVEINIWCKSLQQQQSIASAVSSLLNGYRGGSILMASLADQDNEALGDEQEGDVYHCVQTFNVWATS